jgi:hypothetical protein
VRSGLLLGLGAGLDLLLLLGGWDELEGFLNVRGRLVDRRELGLVDNGLEVADEVGDLGADGGVESDHGSTLDRRGDGKISEGDALSDEESAGGEMGIEGFQRAELALCEGCMDLWCSLDEIE